MVIIYKGAYFALFEGSLTYIRVFGLPFGSQTVRKKKSLLSPWVEIHVVL